LDFDLLIAPLITLLAGVVIGTIFNFAPIKALKHKAIILASFVVISSLGLYVASNLFCYNLTSIQYFQSFTSILQGSAVTNLLGGYAPYASAILLSALFEASLALSFAGESSVGQYLSKQKHKNSTETFQTPPIKQSTLANGGGLMEDEQSIMTLFRDGKISQITPAINASLPDGYSFEGALQDWDPKRTRYVLDSLVQKGQLKAELIDKAITCTACGSANVRIKKICPDCNSLLLNREDHTPPSYVCVICKAKTASPLFVAKCENCGTTAELDEEPEIELFKYTKA
jgi:hypothetical protein